jgi:HK97 gp10 family phage protein
MIKLSVKVEGLSELNEGILELPKATGTNVLKRALLKGADPISSSAKRAAPRLSGRLEQSITPSIKLSRRQRSLYPKEARVEIYVGAGALVQAITQEFGTINNKPQPFMRPAWNENKHRTLEIIREELANELEKARQRIARKTARLAAKGG